MAQTFQINGANLTYVMGAEWRDLPVGEFLNGQTAYSRVRRHVLITNVMTVAEFDTLYALEGQKVSLTTTKYEDRNGDYVTYYGVEVKRVVEGKHEGPLMHNVKIECLVRI